MDWFFQDLSNPLLVKTIQGLFVLIKSLHHLEAFRGILVSFRVMNDNL
jgi:hypothetical protein